MSQHLSTRLITRISLQAITDILTSNTEYRCYLKRVNHAYLLRTLGVVYTDHVCEGNLDVWPNGVVGIRKNNSSCQRRRLSVLMLLNDFRLLGNVLRNMCYNVGTPKVKWTVIFKENQRYYFQWRILVYKKCAER